VEDRAELVAVERTAVVAAHTAAVAVADIGAAAQRADTRPWP
jgi:hypothetical protein